VVQSLNSAGAEKNYNSGGVVGEGDREGCEDGAYKVAA